MDSPSPFYLTTGATRVVHRPLKNSTPTICVTADDKSCESPFPLSQRFGHPHSHIPSVLGIPGGGWGMPKTLIASTLPKLFQTGEKSGLSITNLRLNSVDTC